MTDPDWDDPTTGDLARRLAATDFSADSRIRHTLRARLLAGGPPPRPVVPAPARRLAPAAWLALALVGLLTLAMAGGWAGHVAADVQAATPTHPATALATSGRSGPTAAVHTATGVPTPAPTGIIVATQAGALPLAVTVVSTLGVVPVDGVTPAGR